MPLFNIVGATSINDTFEIGFAWVSNEEEEDYSWCLYYLHEVAEAYTVIPNR